MALLTPFWSELGTQKRGKISNLAFSHIPRHPEVAQISYEEFSQRKLKPFLSMSDTFTRGMSSAATELPTGVRKCLWLWNEHWCWEKVKKLCLTKCK